MNILTELDQNPHSSKCVGPAQFMKINNTGVRAINNSKSSDFYRAANSFANFTGAVNCHEKEKNKKLLAAAEITDCIAHSIGNYLR
jgi:hypothetical protein